MAKNSKYGKITVELDSSSHPLNGSNEPVFLLRAQDICSLIALKAYRDQFTHEKDAAVAAGVDAVVDDFITWQSAHAIKFPD